MKRRKKILGKRPKRQKDADHSLLQEFSSGQMQKFAAEKAQSPSYLEKDGVGSQETTAPITGVEDLTKFFDRYEIIAELGRGGMGIVYKCQDRSLNRIVALKIINQALIPREEDQKRFYREARLMARLKHPHIVDIYDFGYEKGHFFFTMEFIPGETLGELLRQNVTTRRALDILQKTAEAVHHAHQQGIIHRDLKPANIMVDDEYNAKVMDFGLAKEVQEQEKISKTRQVVGTLEYMSPEQADGDMKAIDMCSDVYSLGAILYQVLVGKPPFMGTTPVNTLQQILFKEPLPPSRLQPRVAKDLEAICLKALEKKKGKRYPTAMAFPAISTANLSVLNR